MTGRGFLHGDQRQDLEQVILHDVPDDPELVKVSSSTLGTKRLLERYLYGSDVVTVPGWTEYPVAEAQRHEILHHLLTQVVIDTVDLLFLEEGRQVIGQRLRARCITTERLFYDYSGPSSENNCNRFRN